jgi:DNA repair exonuclease SbcCD nuclease subunit
MITTTTNTTEIFTKTNRVCCVADLHIGVHQNSLSWHDTALKWAVWLKEELNKQNIQDIFILGDVYHYRDEVAVNTIHTVHQILDLWRDLNIVILVGNHDAYYKDRSDINSLTILNGKNNITVIDKPTTTIVHGKKLTFLPWGSSISDLPNSDILFGHFEIESFKMNSFKVCDHGTKTSDLLNKAGLILTGHFHLREERIYDNGTIVYVGNPYEMDFGDTGTTKGYYILDITDNSYEFFENKISPKHKKITLSELSQLKTDNSILQNSFNNNIIKLIIDKKISADSIDLLLKKISAFNPFSLSVDYSLYDNSITVDEQNYDASGVDLQQTIEEFIGVLDVEDKKTVIDYCLDLYKRANSL